ncbi:MAG: tRNA (adenosine(37)-N6)-threonylcarbamoyltransferase complex transferase subunit TsaD, partial [Desulfovibrio sp.]|nr:tRNA (adenosine(37)-N6)-threonylcarbamoyltransferase complex transferase subunit TsaD [Desulfovibrio sp.]
RGLTGAAALAARERLAGLSWPRPLERAEDAPRELCDLCASFNLAVAETLLAKTRRAFARHPEARTLLLAGGVAANSLVRAAFQRFMAQRGGRLLVPSPALCTDNAAMVAYAGWVYASRGLGHDLAFETVPRGRAVPDDMVQVQVQMQDRPPADGAAPC